MKARPLSKRSAEYRRGYRAGYAKAMSAGGHNERCALVRLVSGPRDLTPEERDAHARDTRIGGDFR